MPIAQLNKRDKAKTTVWDKIRKGRGKGFDIHQARGMQNSSLTQLISYYVTRFNVSVKILWKDKVSIIRHSLYMAGLLGRAIKKKYRNHQINLIKKLGYTLPRFRSVRLFIRALFGKVLKFIELCMETPCWYHSEGHHHDWHGCRKVTETFVIAFCHQVVVA